MEKKSYRLLKIGRGRGIQTGHLNWGGRSKNCVTHGLLNSDVLIFCLYKDTNGSEVHNRKYVVLWQEKSNCLRLLVVV